MSNIKITFDLANNIEIPTLVLAYSNGNKIGALKYIHDLTILSDMSNPSEFSFSIYKNLCPKWWAVQDFRLIWVAEWDMWFKISVTINENNSSIKNIIATHLPEAELSQINLYGTEINTDDDIDREGYETTVFFNAKNEEASLLHRVMKKAVNFEITHVDLSLCDMQRTFTFDKKTIYDALLDIAEEVHCHFEFGAYMDYEGNLIRTISAYDLEANCNECGYRGEFTRKCSKCGSGDIIEGYGEDTTIFFSVENALDEVTYSTDVDSVKNCFKLEAGDEDMNAAIINCNPTGSDIIWYFSDEMKEDMSDDLISKLDEYNTQYNYYYDEKEYGADLPIEEFNKLVSSYNAMNQDESGETLVPPYIYIPDEGLPTVTVPVSGYLALSKMYYDTIDFELYLQSELMPYISQAGDETSAGEQAELLFDSIKTVAVSNIDTVSEATAKSAVLSMAKAVVDTRYKVEVIQSSIANQIWFGTLLVTNYSDEEDTCETDNMSVIITGDYETFIKQKIEKTLAKGDDSNYDIVSLFRLNLDDFKKELTRYALNQLQGFYDSCESVLSVLQEQGIGNPSSYDTNSNLSVGDIIDVNLYEEIYVPYYQKQIAIESEISTREAEIEVVAGMQEAIGTIRDDIKKVLDMETFLGEKLWKELNVFRREDVYSNSNYVSDGLSNSEIFQKAEEFFESANKEIIRSATLQHSIKVQLRNIFTIRGFEPMRKGFSVGNWLRIMVDDKVYRLRLINYELNYNDWQNMDVEFSDVDKVTNDVIQICDVLKSAKSMASTYSYVERQASQGSESYSVMTGWVNKGLDATAVNIMNNAESQDVVFGSYGLLCRKYDDILGTYDPEQLKIINSTLAITKNGWETVETAIGRVIYYDPVEKVLKEAYGVNAQVLVGKLILGEELGIYNSSGSLTFNQNGLKVSNDTHDIIIDPNASSIFTITRKSGAGDTNLLSFNDDGNLEIVGDIYATNIKINDSIKLKNTSNGSELDVITLQEAYYGYYGIIIGDQDFIGDSVVIIYGNIYALESTLNVNYIDCNSINVADLKVNKCLDLTGTMYINQTNIYDIFASYTHNHDERYSKIDHLHENYMGNTGNPIISRATNGYRTATIATNKKSDGTYYMAVDGQFGTTNANASSRYNFLSTSSDVRLKTNITDTMINALPVINTIKVREFDWIDSGTHQSIGFIADELEKIDSAFTVGGGYNKDGSMNVKSINTLYLLGYVVKGIQELYMENEALKEQLRILQR